MPGLRRPTPTSLVLQLTQQLAEDYATIALPAVTRVVRDAVAATTGPDGRLAAKAEGIPAVIAVIEHLAREDLDQLRGAVTPAPVARARREPRRSGQRRGVA